MNTKQELINFINQENLDEEVKELFLTEANSYPDQLFEEHLDKFAQFIKQVEADLYADSLALDEAADTLETLADDIEAADEEYTQDTAKLVHDAYTTFVDDKSPVSDSSKLTPGLK